MLRQLRKLEKAALIIVLALVVSVSARADDHRERRRKDPHVSFSDITYILRRQQAYQVEGVPTDRLIIARVIGVKR